jgi:formate C-acetyltransferase
MEVLTKPQKTSTEKKAAAAEPGEVWRRFEARLWQRDINMRWFLQQNYTPYDGDGSFLAPASESTKRIWKNLEDLFIETRNTGVPDVSLTPSSITAHAPGYIDKDNEVIVELQTDASLKRAIMPNRGWRIVLSCLKTYGYEAPSRRWTRWKSIAHTAPAAILFAAAGKKKLVKRTLWPV